jgi:hypothetical protein
MYKKIFFLSLTLILFVRCNKPAETDTTYPVIDISFSNAFPKNCDTLYVGESTVFIAGFSDNVALGSFSLDIHHNFDHHTHTTESAACAMDPKKTPVKPFLLINSFDIPGGEKSYTASHSISIPADVDTGDYHLMIRLTDKEGWQSMKGLGLKLLKR